MSNDRRIATVDALTGVVTGVAPGTAEIRAAVYDNTGLSIYSSPCTVTVRDPDPFHPYNIEYMRYTRIQGVGGLGKTDHTISVIKSSLYDSDYCIITDHINAGIQREYYIDAGLKYTLESLERGYQEKGLIFSSQQESMAHAAKGETDQLVEKGYFSSNSTEYYGVWAYNYTLLRKPDGFLEGGH